MACEITISPPVGQEDAAGQGITTLTASGTANECSAVIVFVHQTQPIDVTTPEKTAQVTNGQWSVDFTLAEGDFPSRSFLCGRGNKYEIRARCADANTADCEALFSDDLIDCDNCPEVTITATPGDCVDGRRTVHLRAEVISAIDATYTWFFGTDEDNQPGEDSQAGDGSGNLWLPPPDANGVRIVETDHVYEAAGDQPQSVTVRLVTSSGPSAVCSAEHTFTLDPCRCDLTVSVRVVTPAGTPVDADECLAPGDYRVEVTSPTGNNVEYAWSVDGAPNDDETGAAFGFSIAEGEQKTITVSVEQGSCEGSNGVTVRGCEDCGDFDAQVIVLDGNRQDVTSADCLPAGDYTVFATSPTGAGVTYRWSVDNVVNETATGATLQVALGEDDEKIVTLEASRRACRDTATVVLETCPPEDDDDDDDDEEEDGFIPCLLFKLLALIGLGLVIVGAILLLCPEVALPFPPPVATSIGMGLLIGGAVLLGLGLLLWVLICQPDGCDWFALLWQSLILLGLLMIYAGLCPACSWLLSGAAPLILGALLLIAWGRTCGVSRCRVLAEMISLFTFVVNVVTILEMVVAACVVTSVPVAAVIWGATIAAIQAWLWYEANQNNCIQD